MKRFVVVVGAIAVVAVIAWLGVSKYLAEERAAKLDRALMDAEARVMQLENDLEAARQRGPDLPKAQAPAAAAPGSTSGGSVAPAGTGSSTAPTAAAAVSAGAGERVRFAATASGVTNRVRIEGTSSMHNWQVESRLIGGSAEFGAGFPLEPGVEAEQGTVEAAVNVFIPVRSLKSLKASGDPYSSQMDEIMYEKLLAADNPRISYRLQSLTFKQKQGPDSYLYDATGALGVAGVTNEITTPVTVSPKGGGKIFFSTSLGTKMTDFKITPPAPAAAGGVITTGDDVKLVIDWWVNKVVPRQ